MQTAQAAVTHCVGIHNKYDHVAALCVSCPFTSILLLSTNVPNKSSTGGEQNMTQVKVSSNSQRTSTSSSHHHVSRASHLNLLLGTFLAGDLPRARSVVWSCRCRNGNHSLSDGKQEPRALESHHMFRKYLRIFKANQDNFHLFRIKGCKQFRKKAAHGPLGGFVQLCRSAVPSQHNVRVLMIILQPEITVRKVALLLWDAQKCANQFQVLQRQVPQAAIRAER